jgi:DNA-binding NarL/FixJ family response regulator
MKSTAKQIPTRIIRVALVENDPLRSVGFRALFDEDPGFAVKAFTPASIFKVRGYDVVLIGSRTGPAMYDIMTGLKSLNPSVRMIATGNQHSDEMALRALCCGAKGFIEESAPAEEFRRAIREVYNGAVWASPQLLGKFVERITAIPRLATSATPLVFTEREREVLQLLVSGRTNKEIAAVLEIEERTIKMHIASLMRKAGVTNRIALSVHALTHSLLGVTHTE